MPWVYRGAMLDGCVRYMLLFVQLPCRRLIGLGASLSPAPSDERHVWSNLILYIVIKFVLWIHPWNFAMWPFPMLEPMCSWRRCILNCKHSTHKKSPHDKDSWWGTNWCALSVQLMLNIMLQDFRLAAQYVLITRTVRLDEVLHGRL